MTLSRSLSTASLRTRIFTFMVIRRIPLTSSSGLNAASELGLVFEVQPNGGEALSTTSSSRQRLQRGDDFPGPCQDRRRQETRHWYPRPQEAPCVCSRCFSQIVCCALRCGYHHFDEAPTYSALFVGEETSFRSPDSRFCLPHQL